MESIGEKQEAAEKTTTKSGSNGATLESGRTILKRGKTTLKAGMNTITAGRESRGFRFVGLVYVQGASQPSKPSFLYIQNPGRWRSPQSPWSVIEPVYLSHHLLRRFVQSLAKENKTKPRYQLEKKRRTTTTDTQTSGREPSKKTKVTKRCQGASSSFSPEWFS